MNELRGIEKFKNVLERIRKIEIIEEPIPLKDIKTFEEFKAFFQVDNSEEEKVEFFQYFQNLTDEEKQQQIKAYQYELTRKQIEESTFKPADIYNCKRCRNTGIIPFLYWNSNAFNGYKGVFQISEAICKCKDIRRSLAEMKRNGLLPLLHKNKFSNFYIKQDFQKVIKTLATTYLNLIIKQNKNPWFFIGGQTGCGKTHICCALLGQLINEGIYIKYFDYTNDIDKIKRLQFKDSDEYLNKIEDYKNCDILYFDDFMYGDSVSDYDIKLLFNIINNRYINRKPCIISSEKRIEDILNIKASIGGRIKEMTGEFCINIFQDNNKNYRILEEFKYESVSNR